MPEVNTKHFLCRVTCSHCGAELQWPVTQEELEEYYNYTITINCPICDMAHMELKR